MGERIAKMHKAGKVLIEWDEERFSVGVPAMDDQHKNWINMINDLHAAFLGKADSVTVEKLIAHILDYCRYHFAAEEALMKRIGYVNFVDHRDAHARFFVKIKAMESDLLSGSQPLKTQIMCIMKNWLEEHILTQDMDYRNFIESKGVLNSQ